MATGNRVLPGAPATAERTVPPEQVMTAGQAAGNAGHVAGRTAGQPVGQIGMQPAERQWRMPRRGSGGRWVVWLLRGVVWAVLLIVGFRGVASIVTGGLGPGGSGTGSQSGGFPVALAQAYALEFGQVYLSFSPANAGRRASELAQFLPPGADPSLGWSGTGTQLLQSEQVAGIDVHGPHSAVVILLARVSGHLEELGVPVYASSGRMVVAGLPALLPPPGRLAPPVSPHAPQDQALARTLMRELPAFFRAFAGADRARLGRFTVPGGHLADLGGSVVFDGIAALTVPAAGGTTRSVTVTVSWLSYGRGAGSTSADAPAQIDMTYALTVVQRGGRWYVRSIGASDSLAGPTS